MEPTAVYLETDSHDPAFNLAFEEYILHEKTGNDHLLLWQNDNAVIIGRNQNTEEEINKKFVSEHGIKVVRRNTGGGAVYHDLGNLNYSFITKVDDESRLSLSVFTDTVVSALRKMGLDAEASGRNDILVSGCKVSGTAQHLHKGRLLYHGTLLFDSDIDMIAGALNVDETKFESKSAKSVRSRVGNIKGFIDKDMTLERFWQSIKENLSEKGIREGNVGADELAAIRKLKAEKYDTWEWNYGKTPEFSMKSKRRWPGGTIEAALTVKKGIVEDIAIYGDFLALRPMDATIEILKGLPFKKEEFEKALWETDFEEIFGGIRKEELLETIFRE